MVSIASWNVNSVKARLEHLQKWLEKSSIDILLLQELKCETDQFPYMEIEALGYKAAVHGQKSYNGVAILAKQDMTDIKTDLPGYSHDEARYIEATIGDIKVASAYVVNGQEVGSDKFDKKREFYAALKQKLKQNMDNTPYILGGDFNVANQKIDAYKEFKKDRILVSTEEKAWFRELINLGYYDTYRELHPQKQAYSWWDYRAGSFEQNTGFRIDYILTNPAASNRLKKASIDVEPRSWQRPSDHVPVIAELV